MQTFRDIVEYEFVLTTLVGKDLKASYRNMALGFLWSLLNPLVMIGVLSFVLVVFLKQPADTPAMVVVALIPFTYIQYCISGCSYSITGNSSLVKKVSFPRQILPISVIVTNLVHFLIQSTLIFPIFWLFPPEAGVLGWQLLWLFPIFVLHIGLCIGAGLLVAGANVVYRDVQYIVDSVLTVLYWLSPVLYDARVAFQNAPDWAFYLYYANPVSGILDSYRAVIYRGSAPDFVVLGMAAAGVLLIGYIGVRSFWIHEKRFGDLVA